MTPNELVAGTRSVFESAGMTRDGHRVVAVEDDTMVPTLKRGDCVLVDPAVEHYRGEGLYVVDSNGYPQVYRVTANFKGALDLLSDNKAYTTFSVAPKAFADILLGKVIALGIVTDPVGFQRLIEQRSAAARGSSQGGAS